MRKGLLQELVLRLGGQPLRLGHWRADDRQLIRLFSGAGAGEESTYVWVFRYLLTGFLEWRSADGARAAYPGLRSIRGRDSDEIEGFSRFAPVMAAWLAGGRAADVATLDGRHINIPALLASGMTAGTDPSAAGYWGDCGPLDQRICEAADVALALWLAREQIWPLLRPAAQDRLLHWLSGAARQEVHDNNWQLFPEIIAEVLRTLRPEIGLPQAGMHYRRFRRFYLGDGWFADGQPWSIDHYNGWGIHYALYWLGEIAPDYDAAFLGPAFRSFVRSYQFLLSPAGIPLIGRSLHYRLAAPAPLIAAQRRLPDVIAPGLARRALAAIWGHLVPRGAIRAGMVTQGYEGADPAILDYYSGPASPLWSLRALIPALREPSGTPFWTAPLQPLPVEERDFRLPIPAIGWMIEGRHDTGEVTIHRQGEIKTAAFERLGRRQYLAGFLGPDVTRPLNIEARYFAASYSTGRKFWRPDG